MVLDLLRKRKEVPVITNLQGVTPTAKQKVYFIRVKEDEYKKITALADAEDRTINKMANILLKSALESRIREK
jgi:hypothetical protein